MAIKPTNARQQITTTGSWLMRFARQTNTDPNIEARKKAGEVLETVADVGSYFCDEDLLRMKLITGKTKWLTETTGIVLSGFKEAANAAKTAFLLAEKLREEKFELEVKLWLEQNENKRLRALLEEHCKGCPASELK